MKRLLTIVAFIFSFMFVVAQTPNKHLTFKGIPITGTLESFAQELGAKGFKKTYSDKTSVEFEGEFAGYSECEIYIYKVPNRNIVHKVVVFFPEESSWEDLEKEYNQCKGMLTNKYGKPISCSETFKGGASNFRDSDKMSLVEKGECNYLSQWKVDNGSIELYITYGKEESYGLVILKYNDRINSALAEKATENDL